VAHIAARGELAMDWKIGSAIGVIVVIVLALIGGLIFFAKSQPTKTQSIVLSPDKFEPLDFCSTESECLADLAAEGMPAGYLEENNLKITCSGGACSVSR
jgi:hypothetical protein